MEKPRIALALLLAFAGCRGSDQPQYAGPAEALVGGGNDVFIPILDPGDRLPIIHGPQGGYHIFGSVLARYVAIGRVRLDFTLTRSDGELINTVNTTGRLSPVDGMSLLLDGGGGDGGGGPRAFTLPGGADGWAASFGSYVFVPGELVPAIDGRSVRLRAVITDADGRAATDERVFIAASH